VLDHIFLTGISRLDVRVVHWWNKPNKAKEKGLSMQ